MQQLELIINDENITNDRGWRLRNSGLDKSRYLLNPVLLYQHDTERIIGRCTNLRQEGSQLIGSFELDENDMLTRDIVGKVERGYLRGASPGLYIRNITHGEDFDTVMDWELLEVSLVTLPSNKHAVRLYADDRQTPLSEDEINTHYASPYAELRASNTPKQHHNNNNYTMTNNQTVTLTALAPEVLSALNLTPSASLEEVKKAVLALHTALSEEKARNNELENTIAELKAKEGEALVAQALADGRIPEVAKEHFTKLFASDATLCKSILASLPKEQKPSIASILKAQTPEADKYNAPWDTLDRQNLLAALKHENPELYKQKFEERFPGCTLNNE